jgi:acyl carrier protein
VGLDSLAVTELVLIAKDDLGITVDEDELHGLRTVGDMADFLTAHAARTGATANAATNTATNTATR